LGLGPWPAFQLEIVLTVVLILINIATANEIVGPPTSDEAVKSGA
jgi:hypothetical protein